MTRYKENNLAGCNSHIAVTLSGCVYNPRVDRFVVDGVLTSVGSTYLPISQEVT